MAPLPTHVQPGDIISSNLMTEILEELARLGQTVPSGSQLVPNVFGMRLIDARAIITQPARKLNLGFVIDASGAGINPNASANSELIVLNQSPPADTRVAVNASVNLVVSAAGGSGPQPQPPPTIARLETPTGAVTLDFPVGGNVVIVGTNFSSGASQNTVTIANTATAVSVDPADPTRRLFVTVPTGIPGAPTTPGDAPLNGVSLRLTVGSSAPVTTTMNIIAPVPNAPTISTVTPQTQFETQDITIQGTNFVTATDVIIRGTTAASTLNSPTEIVATVPDFGDIPPGALVPASLVVSTPGVGDDTFTGTFRVRGA